MKVCCKEWGLETWQVSKQHSTVVKEQIRVRVYTVWSWEVYTLAFPCDANADGPIAFATPLMANYVAALVCRPAVGYVTRSYGWVWDILSGWSEHRTREILHSEVLRWKFLVSDWEKPVRSARLGIQFGCRDNIAKVIAMCIFYG